MESGDNPGCFRQKQRIALTGNWAITSFVRMIPADVPTVVIFSFGTDPSNL